MELKIEAWRAKNFRNIELVDIEVKDYVMRVSGKNGSGKSSVIEAIFVALLGPKYVGKNAQRLIKKGRDKAVITVNMNDGDRDLEIVRTISEKGMSLKIKTSDGSKVSQAYLDTLINMTMIDPLKWANAKPSDQISDVKEKAGIDTSDLEDEYNEIFKERTFQNREVKRLKGVCDTFSDIEPIDGEVISIQDAYARRDAIIEKNNEINDRNRRIAYVSNEVMSLSDSINSIDQQIANLKEKRETYVQKKDEHEKFLEDNEEMELLSLESAEENIKIAHQMSERLSALQEKNKADEELLKASEIAKKLTETLEGIKKKISDTILDADLPFSNISFDEDLGVIVDGIPVSEHSTAEQIKIAIKLNSKFAPHLKIVYIKDGSLLDSDTLEELEDLGVDNEYLFLVELVEEQEDSIIMRSGSIVEYDEHEEGKKDKEAL